MVLLEQIFTYAVDDTISHTCDAYYLNVSAPRIMTQKHGTTVASSEKPPDERVTRAATSSRDSPLDLPMNTVTSKVHVGLQFHIRDYCIDYIVYIHRPPLTHP